MTSYAKKLPIAVGILFFSLTCAIALFSGTELATALIRGAISGAVATITAALLGYILFAEELPETDPPPDFAKTTPTPKEEQ